MINIIILTYIFIVTITIVLVITENRNPIKVVPWVLVIIFIPIIGLLWYLIFGVNIRERKVYQNTPLIEQNSKPISGLNDTCKTSIELYEESDKLIQSLESSIISAEKSINIEFSHFNRHNNLDQLYQLLTTKSIEGIKVRILYDDVASRSIKSKVWQQFENSNIEVKSFAPVRYPYLTRRSNYRNNKQLIVIDQCETYILDYWPWGNNPTYIRASIGNGYRIISNTLNKCLLNEFKCDWKGINVTLKDSCHNIGYENQSSVSIISSTPKDHFNHLEMRVSYNILTAKKDIKIATPIFLPTNCIMKSLEIASQSGVNVSIIVPRHHKVSFIRNAMYSYIPILSKCNIDLYEDREANNNRNYMIIDDSTTFIGSARLDFRSFENNYEIMVQTNDSEHTKQLIEQFKQRLFICRSILKRFKRENRIKHTYYRFVSLFIPLL